MGIVKKERTEFKFWFKLSRNNLNWSVYEDENLICELIDNDKIEFLNDEEIETKVKTKIKKEFNDFKKTRPEYQINKTINLDDLDDNEYKHIYEILLTGSLLAISDSDDFLPNIEKCLKWLEKSDFYTAPSSTKFHDAFESGLVYHSIKVFNKVLEFIYTPTFNKAKLHEAVFVALVHDWCKIGLYESYMRNVKNDENQWVQVAQFKTRDRETNISPEFGHGTSSLFIVSRLFPNVSKEILLAIQWHMGAFDVTDIRHGDLCRANAKYPLVLLIQFADHASIVDY